MNESLCPTSYQLKKDENEAIFYKIEPHSVLSIPEVSETIVVDKMLNVKLFSVTSIPLREYNVACQISEALALGTWKIEKGL